MFFPEDSLKRGGRFYLCWLADSWPLRFTTISHRELGSHNIRKICDDLLEVMTTESGRPAKRFSLRLSSQLLRGLVRLHQRKVNVLLVDLCMITATVMKNSNKKWMLHEPVIRSDEVQLPRLPIIIHEDPENDPKVEELIQCSNNVVANIEEITLKEPTLPENQSLLNDGFGDLRVDLHHTGDRTVEMMMLDDVSALQHSALEMPFDFSTDKSHDKSRLAPHDTALMERISEHDVSMLRKSTGTEHVSVGNLEKEIPEILDIPPPDLNALDPDLKYKDVPVIQDAASEATKGNHADEIIVLEELEAQPQGKRRRLRNKLIIDKNTQLTTKFLRSRIDNIALERRCEDTSEDVVNIRVPVEYLFNRPAHGGKGVRPRVSPILNWLFTRNLGVANRTPLADREMEDVMKRTEQSHTRYQLERMQEHVDHPIEGPQMELQMQMEENVSGDMHLTKQGIYQEIAMDITELPTQVVQTLQQANKRPSENEFYVKRQRTVGYVSFRRGQQQLLETVYDAEKENISQNINVPINESVRSITAMLQKEGLADMQRRSKPDTELTEPSQMEEKLLRKTASDGSETPLGSLDRTKVSLGDSDRTTDSIKFIREQWGTEGTMFKILYNIKEGMIPLDIKNLVAKGPVVEGCQNIIKARCFTSVLKLKQHGFINIRKDPDTLAIRDITLGPKFEPIN